MTNSKIDAHDEDGGDSEHEAEHAPNQDHPADENELGEEEHEGEVDTQIVHKKSESVISLGSVLGADNTYGDEHEEEAMHEESPTEIGPIGDNAGITPEISVFDMGTDESEEEYIEEEESEKSLVASEFNVNANLDKTLLQDGFEEVYRYKKNAERRKTLLNRKVSEYFRRQQNYGVFIQESLSQTKDYLQRYRTQLLELDKRLANKKQFEIDSQNLIGPLKKTLTQTISECHTYIADFEKLFFDTAITLQGGASGKELKETTVLNIIKRMQNVRNIVNKERLTFIITQNKVAEIEVKAKSLEDLGNGLRMVDFEQLRSETQSLSDKIEERNNELEKLRLRCNADTQILAHVREKDFMLHKIIRNQREILNEKNADVDMAREQCNQLKGERDQYRKKHSELSIECGLLDKPLLLRDFDITVDTIEAKRLEIARLQEENAKIEIAVREIAIILSEGELIKTESQKFEEYLLNEISFMDAPIFPRIKKN